MAKQGNVRTATATSSLSLFLPARGNRVALVLFPPLTGGTVDYRISNDPAMTAVAGIGIFMSKDATVPIYLDASTSGDLVKQPLYMIALSSVTFGFIETIEG